MLQLINNKEPKVPPGARPEFDLTAVLRDARIDLVKSVILGLSLKQARTLAVINSLVQSGFIHYSEIDENHWYHIDAQTLVACDPAGHSTHSAKEAMDHLVELEQKSMIEFKELEYFAAPKIVLRPRMDIVIWG